MVLVRFVVVLLLSIFFVDSFHQQVPKNTLQQTKENLKQILGSIVVGSSAFGLGLGAAVAEEAKKPKRPKVLETDNGVKYIEVKKGDGNYPSNGDFVVINYTGFLQNGTVFDSIYEPGKKPLSFRIGKNQIIPGIEEVLKEMRAGGEVTCTIPSKLAYKERGVCVEGGCIVPPNANLNYVIKLKNVAAGYQ